VFPPHGHQFVVALGPDSQQRSPHDGALNAAWAFVFFAMHQVLAALIIILAMDVITAVLIARIWPPHRASAILLVPYLTWISYFTWHQCRDLVA
jgi:tryptophan-rich sensory protein